MSERGRFRHRGDRPVHRGRVWEVVTADFEAPDGTTFTRDIVRSPGAVGVVPITASGELVLVEQYRPAPDSYVVEIPAGMRDVPGEDPATTATRELAEEVGLRPGSMELLAETLPAVGMTDQVTTIFLATGCVAVERTPLGPEEEHAEVVTTTMGTALGWIESGRIRDGKTIIGITLASRRLGAG